MIRTATPPIHYVPRDGFMDGPNGLIFHDGEWHLSFRLTPFKPKAGRVHWGHAVSRDLPHWRDLLAA